MTDNEAPSVLPPPPQLLAQPQQATDEPHSMNLAGPSTSSASLFRPFSPKLILLLSFDSGLQLTNHLT